MKKPFLLFIGITFLFACNSTGNPTQEVVKEPIVQNHDYSQYDSNSRNSVDWQGMYSGVLPCVDCEGIRMALALQDGKYRMTKTYLVKDSFSRHTDGEFTWSDDGSTIVLSNQGDASAQYKVVENKLFQLDKDGKVITGELAERYVLEKANSPILDIIWKLSELDGKIVEVEGSKPFNLVFDTAIGAARGFTGCNGFSSEFQIKGKELELFGVFRTELACPAVMKIEEGYLKALEEVDSFALETDKLVLKKGDAVLAKLVNER